MSFTFHERQPDSPAIEMIWRTESEGGGSFISVAASHWEMVVTRQGRRTTLTVRGPETKARPAPIPEQADFLGIIFKHGVYMPRLPVKQLVDREIQLPGAGDDSFWLFGSIWQFPDFDNADTFVSRLIREGLLVREAVVTAALQGRPTDVSLRSVQRRFREVTGLSQNTLRQIERARYALELLAQGVPILDTVFQAGYYDQPHLTRALKRFAGQTPAQLAPAE